MKPIRLAATICELRKKRKLSQEQLACALHLSPQAVSKWETAAAMPDLQTLPLIADFFGVSLDYLFYGEEFCHQDIYETVFHRVAAHAQMSKQSYEDAFALFWNAHHGISRGNTGARSSPPAPRTFHTFQMKAVFRWHRARATAPFLPAPILKASTRTPPRLPPDCSLHCRTKAHYSFAWRSCP